MTIVHLSGDLLTCLMHADISRLGVKKLWLWGTKVDASLQMKKNCDYLTSDGQSQLSPKQFAIAWNYIMRKKCSTDFSATENEYKWIK